jgi:UDP-glucose:(heptosyl)LPS alpha-1,3-glucosyltransferase
MLHVITPGVDIPGRIATKKEARYALSTSATGQIVLFVANDYRRKGLDALLQAMTGLPTAVRLLVAGSCAQMGTYRALARAMGLGDRVEFLGPQQDMQMAYACADVLAHPTLEDSFGMVVLEAMAHGLPVLVSGARYCGVAASLLHEQNALLLVDPKNTEEVRVALHRILTDKALADALIANGADVVRMHTWQHAAMAYDGLYHRLASAAMGRP